ncbi:hypothetical protein CERSUDRAFT_120334 [Gelatoporia subvermispora B]|uniref:Uncharacterized protein n=1 Tax=Ceriporiopsis subvermispora (strain B) TaxID=914234 RepID=M2QXQ6_CERS8|nr:hypothetical protein CERSUDRAFT_120334 [Gelatoporia subvermispora B]
MCFLDSEFQLLGPSEFLDRHIVAAAAPEKLIDEMDRETGEFLTIPCGTMVTWSHDGPDAGDVKGVHSWVHYYPLRTLQCIMHRVFPQTKAYRFHDVQEPEDSFDKSLIRYSIWTMRSRAKHLSSLSDNFKETLLTVVVQPPWILSSADVRSFVACSSLMNDDPFKTKFRASERLWAKVWDACVAHRSRFFVVTNYNDWVFGAFSERWTRGFVTRVQRYDQDCTTVMEDLVYWLSSAHEFEGSWQIPEIPEQVDYAGLESFAILPPRARNELSVAPSESSWASADALSDTGSDSTIEAQEVAEMLATESVLSGASTRTVRTFPTLPTVSPYERVAEWARDSGQIPAWCAALLPPGSVTIPDPDTGVPVFGLPEPSQCSSSVMLDHADLRSQGGWLVGGVSRRR